MPTKRGPIRLDLKRVDIAGGEASGLPWSLLDAIEADGGLWAAGDWYTDPSDIVAQAKAAGAVALRLDCRDLAFLDELPDVRYLHVRTDGRPPLEPIASLRGLRALILEVGSLRGTLDLAGVSRAPVAEDQPRRQGRRGDAADDGRRAPAPRMAVRDRVTGEARRRDHGAVPGPPARSGSTTPTASAGSDRWRRRQAGLRNLDVDVVGLRTLDGIEGVPGLEALGVWSSPIVDIGPIRALRELRGLRLWTPRLTSIEPLRGLPRLRFLDVIVDGEPDRSILDSLPALAAIQRRRELDAPLPWADLRTLDQADPLRREWDRLRRA